MSAPPFTPPVPQPLHGPTWARPAGNTDYRVTQTYDHVNLDISKAIHGGVDMGNGHLGGKVFAPSDGTVLAEGWLSWPWSQPTSAAQRARWNGSPTYGGIMCVIRLSPDDIWAGAHLQRTVVSKGQTVKAGQQIGNLGSTGAAYEFGGHLHSDLYRRMRAGEDSPLAPITYDGAKWAKVDMWPLLAQNYTVPDTSTAAPQEDDMRFSGADFHVAPGVPTYRVTENSWFRTAAERKETNKIGLIAAGASVPVAYFVDGELIGTNADWALCFLYVNGAYTSGFLHSSLLEVVEEPAAPTGPSATEVAALVKQGRQAGAQGAADAAATYARAQ